MPRPRRAESLSEASRLTSVCLTSVCLSRTSGLSREQRGLGRLKLAQWQPTSHVTRTPLSRSKDQRSTCRGRGHIVAASSTACYGSESREYTVHFINRHIHYHGYEDATYEYSRHPRTFLLFHLPPLYFPHVQSHSLRAPPSPASPPACCGLVYLPITLGRRRCFSRRTLPHAGLIHQHAS